MINDLNQILYKIEHEWPTKRILVVGDVMLDKYVWGEVGRVSPEAPVPVVRTTHVTEQPGGAANVAMNLAKLGVRVSLVGITGGDQDEKLLVAHLVSNGIYPHFIPCSGFPTVTKTRIVAGRQQMLRLDNEKLGERPEDTRRVLLKTVLAELPKCHVVVLSDYGKGSLTFELCQRVIAEAQNLSIPVLVDPKTADFSQYKGATAICPNLVEFSLASRVDSRDLEAMLVAGERMVEEYKLEYLVATLSEKGIAVVRPGHRFIAPAVARQVFDVSGAGDTVISMLAVCAASSLSIEASVQLANIAAGIVVGKVGTVPVEKFELLMALTPEIEMQASNKILSKAELLSRISVWRSSGETIVFTNGCFDLLHVGHIALLEACRRHASKLVLALNSDASIGRLKGPTRPIVGERERAQVMASLAAVDAVVLFDEDTPLELIRAVKPNVLAKGGDYTVETVVGHEDVIATGGRVEIVPTVAGFSTTNIVNKLTEKTDVENSDQEPKS